MREQRCSDEFQGGNGDERTGKGKVGSSRLPARMGAGAGLAVTAATPFVTEAAASELDADRKKARYQANSTDVQSFYRVNRYPK